MNPQPAATTPMPTTCDGTGKSGIGQPPPPSLAPLFQEYDLQRLDLDRDASLIIERTLEGGSQAEVQWLFQRYGEDRVREAVRDRGARHLSARAFNFWRLVLDIDDWRPHPWPEIAGALWGESSHDPIATIAGLPVAATIDIAAMKLAAIIGRGSKKDFVDLYCLLEERPLDVWLAEAGRKFGDHRDFHATALRALAYFADADPETMPEMRRQVDWETVKARFVTEVRRLGRQHFRVM